MKIKKRDKIELGILPVIITIVIICEKIGKRYPKGDPVGLLWSKLWGITYFGLIFWLIYIVLRNINKIK